MTHKCKDCGCTTELIIKLGGLICRNCRTIIFYPFTDEYQKVLEKRIKKIAHK